MRAAIDAAVADLQRRWDEGSLTWTYATVQSLITPYPRRGQLDKLLPGQEDEATPDPDGVPWTLSDRGHAGSEHGDDSAEDECGLAADKRIATPTSGWPMAPMPSVPSPRLARDAVLCAMVMAASPVLCAMVPAREPVAVGAANHKPTLCCVIRAVYKSLRAQKILRKTWAV